MAASNPSLEIPMKKLALAALTAALLVPAAALACDNDMKSAKNSVKNVTVTELAGWTKEAKAVVLDANNTSFRAKNGVIPGAVLLTNFQGYDVAKELPQSKDSKLVFYCANTHCGASHAAAEKAVTAGYTDVNVLPDGLMGWKKAGQPTSTSPKS
jgi:rhodanese-related sulfurtransferase